MEARNDACYLYLSICTLTRPMGANFGRRRSAQSSAPEGCKEKSMVSSFVSCAFWVFCTSLVYLCMCGGARRMALWCTMHGVVENDASCTLTLSGECEGHWAHAHAGRMQGLLGECPCLQRERAAGRIPMPAACEGRRAHAHTDRVRGRWVHAHAGCMSTLPVHARCRWPTSTFDMHLTAQKISNHDKPTLPFTCHRAL
ncbi:hypothetical protein HAX54_052466 [Datura stramonium]|uniref:Uncharacterized protein n=1 Tax=Datura stramonium TaxID=4076 RepID=A0ABS8WNG3_DATST|nr:hypothetical protein [Datura stramonium]